MNLFIRNFPNDIHRKARVCAAQSGVTLGKFVIKAVAGVVGEVPKSEPKLSTGDLIEKARQAFRGEMGRYPESTEELEVFLKEGEL